MIKVITWNVNGIRAREAEVIALVDKESPDVLCLQEIKASPEEVPPGVAGLTGLLAYYSYWHGKGGYSGVSIHLKKSRFPEAPRFSHPSFDMETRIVEARARVRTLAESGPKHGTADFVFASIYLPNGGKDFPAKIKFLKEMGAYAKSLAGANAVLCGDLNVARFDIDVHPDERKPGVTGQRSDERALFEKIFSNGFSDVVRALRPNDDAMFSWWPYWREARARNVGWRIDYVLASETLSSKAKEGGILRGDGRERTSDHAPVWVNFDVLA